MNRKRYVAELYAAERQEHEFALAELRLARHRIQLHAKMLVVEVDAIGVALKADWIDAEQALEWLHEVGGLGYFLPYVDGDGGVGDGVGGGADGGGGDDVGKQ